MSIAANSTQSLSKSSRSASPVPELCSENSQPATTTEAFLDAPGSERLDADITSETNKTLVDTVTDKIGGESMSLPPDSPNNNQQSSMLKPGNSHSGSEGDSSDKEHSRKRKLSSRSSTANEAAVRLHPKRPKESDVPEREEDSEDAVSSSEVASKPKPVQVFGFGSFASTKSPFTTIQQSISITPPSSSHDDPEQPHLNLKKTEPLAQDAPAPSVALVNTQSTQSSVQSGSTGFAAFASVSPFKRSSTNPSSSAVTSEQRESLAGPVRRSKSPVGKHQAFGQYSTGTSRFGNLAVRKTTQDDVSAQQTTGVQPKPEETAEFEDMLKSKGEEIINDSNTKPDIAEIAHNTGEEQDLTIFQTRAKLYTQDETFAYKERGTGLLKVNVRRSDGEGARIVMRAEGVLRLILNMSLYPGLICELGPDPKFIKIAEITTHERRLHAIKVGNAKLAQELYDHLMENTPDQKISSSKEVAV